MDKTEATQALAEIESAAQRTARLQNYRHFAPHLMLWGAIWLIANSVSDFYPRWGGKAWLGLSIAGGIASFWIGVLSRGRVARDGLARDGDGAAAPSRNSWRWGLTYAAIIGYFVATLSVLLPLSPAQQNAYISLFWAFLYIVMGIWLGWRMFAIGLVTALAIVYGYFMVQSHLFFYMGVVAGGALIAGGLWLRRI